MPGELMEAEMAQQPQVLAALAARRDRSPSRARRAPRPAAGTMLVARGSSDHAAIFGRYLLEPRHAAPGRAGRAEPGDALRRAAGLRRLPRVAISQSGRTPEIATVLPRLAATGGRTLAVTNEPGSPLARAADAALELGAGEERAVPATKTFTAQALAFALLADALGPAAVARATGASAAPWPRSSPTPRPRSAWPRPSATPRGCSRSPAACSSRSRSRPR